MRLTKRLLSELKQYKGLNLKARDVVKIAKEIQGEGGIMNATKGVKNKVIKDGCVTNW